MAYDCEGTWKNIKSKALRSILILLYSYEEETIIPQKKGHKRCFVYINLKIYHFL